MKIYIFDLDDTLFDTTNQLKGKYDNLPDIKPFKGVKSILEKILEKGHLNFLVTMGDIEIQTTKVDNLKIQKYFKDIYYCQQSDEKKSAMKEIMTDYSAEEYIVVGDRPDAEIRYGNELGLKTIRVKQGWRKDLEGELNIEKADITLNSINELRDLI